MKKFFFLFLLIPAIVYGQEKRFDTKHIEVWGNAERTIAPDEIYTSITLKEYKAPRGKVSLNQLEKELVKALDSEKIDDANLTVENISGYNWDWKRRKSDEFLASKSFILKTSDPKKLNDLLARLDPEGLNRVYIERVSHSNIDEIRRELYLEALRDAKSKAKYLVNGIDEVLGGVLEIQEMHQPQHRYEAMEMRMKTADDYQSDVEFQEMKISATIRAVFEID